MYTTLNVRHGYKAQNNGQQVAGHDDRPNIFQPRQTPILAGQINEYYNFFLPDGISNYAGSRSLCCIVVQVLACTRLSDNIVRIKTSKAKIRRARLEKGRGGVFRISFY